MKQCLVCAVLPIVLLAFCVQGYAVVVGSTTGNTTAPPDPSFPWNNVGVTAGATGVYLGDRWVLTARHVHGSGAPTSIAFPQLGTFTADPSSKIEIPNSSPSVSGRSDLALFRLTKDPGLPTLSILEDTPAVGTEVYLVGNGRDRKVDLTYWDTDIRPGRNVWFESDTRAEFAGYKTMSSNSLRWGTNLVEWDEALFWENNDPDHTLVRTIEGGKTILLITEFDRDGFSDSRTSDSGSRIATDFEAQAVVGDSGGGVFVNVGGRWELAGIINAVLGVENQDDPGGPNSRFNAVFGSTTLSANLADYRDTILSLSEYQIGDFDNDGKLTSNDIDLLTGVIQSPVDPPSFDVNRDGTVDLADRKSWVEDLAFTYYGDSNFDGRFNSGDLVTVFQDANYEVATIGSASWESGDWNGDRKFDSGDLVLAFQQARYEKGPRSPVRNQGPIVVPEPTATISLTIGLLFILCHLNRITKLVD